MTSGLEQVAPSRIGPATVARAIWSRHGTLLSNAGALATGTGVTSVLGFAYWWVAARGFSPEAVGTAAAAVSTMSLLAQVGETGLGPLLVGAVPRRPDTAGPLISAALVASACGCLLAVAGYFALSLLVPLNIGTLFDTATGRVWFVTGVVVTGLALVADQALVGLMRSAEAMWRNIGFSLGKLGLLAAVLAGGVSGHVGGDGILATWTVSLVVSLAVLAWLRSRRTGPTGWHRPRGDLLRPLAGSILGHHAVNVALQTPALALPLMVAVTLSPATNAAFYSGWAVLNVALLVPASLATMVYSTGSGDATRVASSLRVSLGISAVAGVSAAVVFSTGSKVIVGLFNPAYPGLVGNGLAPLGLGVLAVGVKYHFVALERLHGRLVRAAAVLAAGGAAELAGAAAGAALGGLSGLIWGWLVAVTGQAVVVGPSVLCELRRPGRG